MATIDDWAEMPLSREQLVLFDPTLDGVIAEDDPVRLLDEVLAACDWSAWEAEYAGRYGQPPLHPRYVAAAILYGLCRGIRSSRKLEEATVYRLDFQWLLLGRRIDHTTLAKFRTKFRQPLKELFRQLGRIAMTLGLVRLGEVAFDGTRVRAHNSRYATRTAQTLAEKLAALDALFEELLQAWEAGDAAEQRSLAGHDSPTRLLPELAELAQQREKIRAALAQAQAADDPTQPVPESQRDDLPRNSQQKLDKSCFVYDAEHDQYHCPQGQTLAFEKSKPDERGGVRVTLRVYRCAACAGCPLAERCVSAQSKQGRTITRDGDEAVRDRTAARLASDAGRKLYNQRPHLAETTFAHVKSILGLRQFLLRGLDKVKHEWRWACTALNLGKLVRHLARVRADLAALAAES